MPPYESLAEPRRREIFRMLVNAQDMQMGVAESYEFIRRQYGLEEDEIRRIEREGMDGDWPPL
jgi:hypothetical protein